MTEPALIPTDRLLDDLRQLCGLPGSADQQSELAIVASRVAALMQQHGLQTYQIATGGAPIVVGRRTGKSPFTLLLYHHYDVAPPGPWRAWHHEPFQLAERDDALYGRGVAHGKGPLLAHLSAISSLIASEGELPCNVVLVVEGEGLSGSPNLGTLLADHRQLLRADACLATGGERDAHGRPICYSGSKGLLQVRLTSVGANQTLAPGMASSVSNPLWRLIWAIAQIKSDQEEVLIGKFYDDVESPTRAENQAMRMVQLDEVGRLSAWGVGQFLFGLSGGTLVSAEATLPTCNVSAISVEPHIDLASVPVTALARLDFHLVPRQRPQTLLELVRTHLHEKGALDIVVERLPGGYPPVRTASDNVFIQKLLAIGQTVYGASLSQLPLGPFTLPLFFFAETYGIPTAVVGCARSDSTVYGPNEHIRVDDLLQHGRLLSELLYACAADTSP